MAILNTEFVTKTTAPGQYRDQRLLGFLLKVSETGVKSFQVQARIRGKGTVRHTIGKFGAPWTCKLAREEAERILHLMKTGIDPRDEKLEQQKLEAAKIAQQKSDELRATLTLRTVFDAWCADERKTKPSTKKLYKEVLYKHLEAWLDVSLCDLTPEMVSKRYDQIADNTVASANNTFRALRRLYNWAILEYEQTTDPQPIPANPVAVLSKRKKWQSVKGRNDLIADDDLKAWFDAVRALNNGVFGDYFILLLVTGLRKKEAARLRWEDINFKQKVFIARDTKNGRDHTLPMTDFVYELFKEREREQLANNVNSEYVFAGKGTCGHIADIRYYQQKVINEGGVSFTPHSLRRTFSYAAARVRLGDSERKALLNHLVRSDITDAHYTPWMVDDLREAILLVERHLIDCTRESSTVQNEAIGHSATVIDFQQHKQLRQSTVTGQSHD